MQLKLDKLNSLFGRYDISNMRYRIVNLKNKLDAKFFDSLVDSSCSIPQNHDYQYNGRIFRSRAEMLYATMLDELDIEYKYDVSVSIGKKIYAVDFAIVFREFNRCILFEFFGRCDEHEYNHSNAGKIENMYNAGIYLGRDLFIMSGDEVFAPGPNVIRYQLASIVAQITEYHVSRMKEYY
ncbi:hypothetical protein SAMN02910456_01902 [Ruminococcaceae bacterium YRB3002]|nr:hypothetical protein SAMN02910456_01902 [Ruminococcaceae bacterium YRB3002]